MEEKSYSVRQAAELLSVSVKTVRNRIANGQLEAVWVDRGAGMSQWLIPARALNLPTTPPKITPLANLPTPNEIAVLVNSAVQTAVRDVVRVEVENLKQDLENRADERDQRLMNVLREIQQQRHERSRSIWKRFFSFGTS